MRYLVLAALTAVPSCKAPPEVQEAGFQLGAAFVLSIVESLVGGWAETDARIDAAPDSGPLTEEQIRYHAERRNTELRQELRQLRLGAGLSEEEYLAEMREYDPAWYRIRMKTRKPTTRTVWKLEYLVYRARLLRYAQDEEWPLHESDILEALRKRDPDWYARLVESGWKKGVTPSGP